jgi:hypothetical protein
MTVNAYAATARINQLKEEYQDGVIYGDKSLLVHANGVLINAGFMGSSQLVSLSSRDRIALEAPGCVAAPLIDMIAKNVISFGQTGKQNHPFPVRIYAPLKLSVTAQHVVVGDLDLLVEPKYGLFTCKTLTFFQSTPETPDYIEIIKSWGLNDDMEVEVRHFES